MNIETRLKTLEQTMNRHGGVFVVVISNSGETPEQTRAMQAARAEGRVVVPLSEVDARL